MELKNPNTENTLTFEEWDALNFPGKEFVLLKENELYLKETTFSKERFLEKVNGADVSSIINSLVNNFKEVGNELEKLEEEWNAAEDKIKLDSKLDKFKRELNNISAIGDFSAVFEKIEEKSKEINDIFKQNYEKRLAILEKAENFNDAEDQDKENAVSFKDILEEWKAGPEIKKHQYDKLSEKFEAIKNAYFDHRRKVKEEREVEQMHHLDQKMQICEEAEKIMDSHSWKKTTDDFHDLLERWKKIGMVPSQVKNEELWERFNRARNTFFENRKSYFDKVQQEQENNLSLKTALVEKAEELKDQTNWRETAEAFAELMEDWKKIGKVPFEKMDGLWQRLQKARDAFFNARRENAKEFKKQLEDNFQKKQLLAERASSIKNSKDWQGTTLELNQLMDEWKSIGMIPREYGNEIWETFISARNHFFKRKDEDREARRNRFKQQLSGRLEQSEQFLKTLEFEMADEEEKLKEFRESLERIKGDHHKDQELKLHLRSLIEKIERKLPSKIQKIEEVKKQVEELIQKNEELNPSQKRS